jgi:hypothetical protein
VENPQPYCLDSNVLIQAWLEYYSPKISPTYWDVMNRLGKAKRIFIAESVYEEIARTEDDLSRWLKESDIEVHKADGKIGELLRKIYAADPSHQHLVDNRKGRSLADPWVIAHALAVNACVVTKENIILQGGRGKVKIPNVCRNMNIRCINDFEFVKELRIQFICESILY